MEEGQKNFDSVSKVLKREVTRFEVSNRDQCCGYPLVSTNVMVILFDH